MSKPIEGKPLLSQQAPAGMAYPPSAVPPPYPYPYASPPVGAYAPPPPQGYQYNPVPVVPMPPPVACGNRALCACCSTPLTYNANAAVVICPKCCGRSVVNRSRLQWYIGFNIALGIICIILGIVLSISSFAFAGDGGVYYVFWGLPVVGICALIRAAVYSSQNWRARNVVFVTV